jgi:hypothetical protein
VGVLIVRAELSVAEQALRKRVRESAWFERNALDFRTPFAQADVEGRGRLSLSQFQQVGVTGGAAMDTRPLLLMFQFQLSLLVQLLMVTVGDEWCWPRASMRCGLAMMLRGTAVQAVARLGVAMSVQELTNLSGRLDSNGDGSIDYYEFAKLIDFDAAEMYGPLCIADRGC